MLLDVLPTADPALGQGGGDGGLPLRRLRKAEPSVGRSFTQGIFIEARGLQEKVSTYVRTSRQAIAIAT